MEGFPLFTYGNELLLFLNQGTQPGDEELYWLIGVFTTFMDVSYDSDGNRYYADIYGIIGESVNITQNYANQDNIAHEVSEYTTSSDSYYDDWPDDRLSNIYRYIFAEKDIIDLFNHYDNNKV